MNKDRGGVKFQSRLNGPLLFVILVACGDKVALDSAPTAGTGQTGYPNGGDLGMVAGSAAWGGSGPGPTGGTSGGGITVEPGLWDFGPVALGSRASRTFTIRNTTSLSNLMVNPIFDGDTTDFSTTSNCPYELAPTASCTVTVWFSPLVLDVVKATLTVSFSLPVLLTGSGTGTASLVLSPSSHAFGIVDLDTAERPEQLFTLTARGGAPGEYTAALSIVVPDGFKLGNDTCTGQSISRGGGSCTFVVSFDGSLGVYSGTIRVTSALSGEARAKITMTATGGLIGHWKFDDAAGSVVSDSSGQKNHGTVRQGSTSSAPSHPAPAWERGRKGGALRIDGLDDWVNVPDSDSIDSPAIKNQISISAWIKLDRYNTLKPFNVVVQRDMGSTMVEQFFMGLNNGQLAVGINFFYGISVTNVPLNEWVHMATTYDGIQQCGYINGAMAICQDVGWPIATDETPFTMGAGINGSDVIEHIVGLIDEVRLYNIHLSPAAIESLHATP
jgi:Concanavalin A-like lectin/glucanases superfamily/Abnormal spindle-like microcephaly-assoc'd, ASPM-SPD-2-Hydin